jgi:capsular polysaccharide biosynthesis protein
METQSLQLQQYLRIIRENWWLILAMVLVSTGISFAYSYSQTSVYEATATFVVNPNVRITQTDDLLYSLDTLAGRTSLVTTYSNVLKSQVIIEQAAASLDIPPQMLEDYAINAVVLPDSSVLSLLIQGPSPFLAADLANAIGVIGVEYISELQEIYELRRLDPAVVNPVPISPNHPVDIALGFVIGVIGGVAFAILRQVLAQPLGEEQETHTPPTSVDYNDLNSQDVNNDRDKTTLRANFSSSQPD